MDEDRGTYSPPTEDNLSYQSRKAPSRDQAPLTLIISGIVLVMLLVFVVLFYNSGLNSHGRTPPDVGNTVGDIKDSQVTDAKPLTGDELNDNGSAKFAPSAEAPDLRDGTNNASTAVDEAPPPVAPIQGPLPSQANNPALGGTATSSAPAASAATASNEKSAGTASNDKSNADAGRAAIDRALTPGASGSSAAAKPTKLASASASASSASAKAKPAEEDAKLAAATAPLHGATVQIGAFQSMDIANKQYANVASSYGLFLGGTAKHVEKVDAANGSTLYRTAFTGFASKDKAHAFCDALKAAGHDCLVK